MRAEVLCLGVVGLFVWIWRSRRRQIWMPGPKGLPFIGVSHMLKPVHKTHLVMSRWSQEHGSVMYLPLLNGPTVVVSDVAGIYEVTVEKGHAFGGRPHYFRGDITTQKTGILTSRDPDDTWKFLRKITHRHLKQFGDGMSRLEHVIEDVGEDMFAVFDQNCGQPFDPNKVIFDAALKSIAFLITGERTTSGDAIVEKMRHYEDRFLHVTAPWVKVRHLLIDYIPWIRFFGAEIWTMLQDFVTYEQEIWTDIKNMNSDNPDANSLCKILMQNVRATYTDPPVSDGLEISEKDARRTSMNLLLAGVTTTSNTFYAAMNILAHNQDVQNNLLKEIRSLFPEGQSVTLEQRPRMHYCRAFVLELLRYSSVVPLSVGHRAICDETIQGCFVPKDTRVIINLYGFHHDPKFWKDPEVIRPERFLDDNGELVPADHPNRKHVMPFGAGARVCIGETLAMTRLFLWITMLINRFQVDPAEGNEPSTMDTENFCFVGVLRPSPYEVILTNR